MEFSVIVCEIGIVSPLRPVGVEQWLEYLADSQKVRVQILILLDSFVHATVP